MASQKFSKNVDAYESDSTTYYIGYKDADYEKPFAKYFNLNVGPISDETQKGIVSSPWASVFGKIDGSIEFRGQDYITKRCTGYEASEAHDFLLRPGYLPIENGYTKTKQGAWMVACRTDMGQGQPDHVLG